VRALADTMTTMARRLDELLRTQRRFVADASHQLRTPLTALRLRLENLQTELPTHSSAELEAAIDETTRLATLVTNLLQLARADERRSVGVVDLSGLTADRIDTWTAVAEAAGVHLVTEQADHPAMVEAVPGSVEQILDNLLDNAVNASPRGGTVTVTVAPALGKYALSVVDEGPGLSDEDKSSAMQRFWRGTRATPGTGLGLAIVDALASASGATVELGDAAGGGLAVTVTFAAGPQITP
jgi:signal transduction histidine kinase